MATCAALSLVVAMPNLAVAQPIVPAATSADDAVDRLGRYIRILSASPRSLDALLGAGQAALDVGDPNAALGFFARAEEVAPSNGRVKAGLGSSLVMIERPDDALRLFAEAVSLGVPEYALARDRGLAYDLRGDSKRAQRDYALATTSLATTRGADEELVRRHALSLGISGNRAAALDMLEPLLRKQDQGAWRARAFILAMTGDVSGANGVARQLMVPAMANAMAPLLSRLAGLNAAERAHAVNFGTVPSDGTQLAVVTGDPFLGAIPRPAAPRYGAPPPVADAGAGLIPAGKPLGSPLVDQKPTLMAGAKPQAPAPGFTTPSSGQRIGQRLGTRISPVDPARLPPEIRGEPMKATQVAIGALPPPDSARVAPPVSVAVASPIPASTPAPPVSADVQTVTATPSGLVGPPVEGVPTSSTAPAFEVPVSTALPAPPVTEPAVPTGAAVAKDRLAGLLEGLEREPEAAVDLPNSRELRAARAAARKKVTELATRAAADEAAKKIRDEKAAAAKRDPARLWVQVATGRNDSGLGITWRRIRDGNAAALKGQASWSAPFRATNRILVGPMKSAAAARELVGKLAKGGVQATTWSSEAGEEVTRIAAK